MKNILQSAALACVTALALPLHAQDYHIQLRATLDYPGQTLSNICGYAQNGQEYALVGASQGLSIVNVTNPENIYEIVQIPGPNSRWREIKTFSHYAYITTEGGGGLQIVDLSALPSPNLSYHSYTDSAKLNNIHALHIDVTKGFLYTYGGNQNSALAHDLKADPYNPVYAGRFDQLGYVHDGYVDNDTLYACHINTGFMSIVDMSDKKNPVLLGSVETPGKFTHNSWLLSDHKHILTTDEEFPSFVTAYDVSDPGDIRELDRIARDGGMQSIGHNTHVLNDWAITSWYIDGMTIVDAHRPINLVQVARFDTWAPDGKFDGCWGVYPFLPSGNLVATNIPIFQNAGAAAGRLFVLTPTYVRACYLEGKIVDGCTGQTLIGADIKINHTDPLNFTQSDNSGIYRTGQPTPGNFTATISKTGYLPQTFNISLKTAEVTELNVTLEPTAAFNVTALAVDQDGKPLANLDITLQGDIKSYDLVTDASGKVDISCMPGGTYRAGAWGYEVIDWVVNGDGTINIPLSPAYYDDFELDLGWNTLATASSGLWERGEPKGTFFGNDQLGSNPESDIDSDVSDQCYVTGNAGGAASADDVDNGMVTLSSPPMQLAQYPNAIFSFWYWFFNNGGTGNPNDNFTVRLTNGQQAVTVLSTTESQSQWRYSGELKFSDFLPLTDNMQVEFITADQNPGHLVEAGVDVFNVTPGAVATFEPDPTAQLSLTPNPSTDAFQVAYNWPDMNKITLDVRNLLGQTVFAQQLNASTGIVRFGNNNLPAGVYMITLRSEGRQSVVVKAVKQ